jgi:hypothetical protein
MLKIKTDKQCGLTVTPTAASGLLANSQWAMAGEKAANWYNFFSSLPRKVKSIVLVFVVFAFVVFVFLGESAESPFFPSTYNFHLNQKNHQNQMKKLEPNKYKCQSIQHMKLTAHVFPMITYYKWLTMNKCDQTPSSHIPLPKPTQILLCGIGVFWLAVHPQRHSSNTFEIRTMVQTMAVLVNFFVMRSRRELQSTLFQ